ncbi:MAG: efflux RND transporter periplasmic adaptor subunit [Nitrospirae bacterium]|nr:efflux RND transporter periplasmic adaptor subunit [Nitrospirota bacterium]
MEIIKSTDRVGVPYCLVKALASGEMYTLRDRECFLFEQIRDGVGLQELRSRFEARYAANLDMEQLEAFVRHLGQCGLIPHNDSEKPSVWEKFQSTPAEAWTRWRLFNPEKASIWLYKRLKWCYTRSFGYAVIALFILAAGIVFFNWDVVLKDLKLLVMPLRLIQMFIIMYLFVNFPQEIARGVTGTHFGNNPSEFGIWIVYDIMPRFYCISEILELREKSQRNWILFSPAFCSVITGSLGILLWKLAAPGVFLRMFGLSVAFLSTIDLVVRLNVFWPNEGYYMLANWLQIPNFRRRAVKQFQVWALRKPLPEPLTLKEKRTLVSFGTLTSLLTLPCLAVVAYYGGKMLINSWAGLGALFFLGLISIKYRTGIFALIRESKMLQWISNIKYPHFKKLGKTQLVAFWIVATVAVLLCPYPYEVGGPFKLLPQEHIELHTKVAGEVKGVLVRENSQVKKGDVQAIIDTYAHKKNLDAAQADLDKARYDLKLLEGGRLPADIKKAEQQMESAKTHAEYSRKEEVRLRALFREGAVSQEEYENSQGKADVDKQNLEVAKANLQSVKDWPHPEEVDAQKATVRDLQAKVKFYEENLQSTQLIAPISGRVVTPYVERKVGQFLKEGDLFAEYENKDTIQAEIQIPEFDIGEVKVGSTVKVRPQAYPTRFFYGTVVLIAPTAALQNQNDASSSKVIRVITEIPNANHELWPEMTGDAKIKGGWKPLSVAFSKPMVRFFMVEVWSWFP